MLRRTGEVVSKVLEVPRSTLTEWLGRTAAA